MICSAAERIRRELLDQILVPPSSRKEEGRVGVAAKYVGISMVKEGVRYIPNSTMRCAV